MQSNSYSFQKFAGILALAAGCLATPCHAVDYFVSPGQSLQDALDRAVPGDTITVQAGGVYTGLFKLRKKSGTGWITIRSSALSSLPAGERITPKDAIHMPKLVANSTFGTLTADNGAHHYRIIGIEMTVPPGMYPNQVVVLGDGSQSTISDVPTDIEFDRVYIHGDPDAGGKRGITLNARNTTIKNSHISSFKSTWQDTQTIAGWNGPGPFLIENNFLEAAAECAAFGGSKPSIPNLVPSDITFRRNHCFKPFTWMKSHENFRGTAWLVKNGFELKNARRVLIEGNVFTNVWMHGQAGYAIVLVPRTLEGAIPWTVIEDVTIRKNIFRRCSGGVALSGMDDNGMGKGRNFRIEHNLFEDINSEKWGGPGHLLLVLNKAEGVVFEHNTGFHTGKIAAFDGKAPMSRFVYRNNISPHNTYGIIGNSRSTGISTLSAFAPDATVTHNVMAGGNAGLYPEGNYFPASLAGVEFVDMVEGNYRLSSASPYLGKGTDGRDLGADLNAVYALTRGVVKPR
jgi:hypothetical protein